MREAQQWCRISFIMSCSLCYALLELMQSIESGDISQSEKSASELAEFLDSVSESVISSSDSEDDDLRNNALEMLTYTLDYVRSASAKEVLNLFCQKNTFYMPRLCLVMSLTITVLGAGSY